MTIPAGTCYQINMQRHFGGGEVYTQFFSKALVSLGWQVVLFVDTKAGYWHNMEMEGVEFIYLNEIDEVSKHLPERNALIISHAPLKKEILPLLHKHIYCCFANMPFYQRSVEAFRACYTVFCVSQYVIDTATKKGLNNCYPEPMYGVAEDSRMQISDLPVKRQPSYDWDERKVRDRLLSRLYPLYWHFRPKPTFKQRDGLTLGIVSRITPIKQFPLLFEHLAPVIKQHPEVNLEIFGSGGYASIRDLKKVLAPIKKQTRFWGQQQNVADIYGKIDFLLTGLPEKEALGLNVIEAQQLGTPVLAPNAPPFTETIEDAKTGFLYHAPRDDGGRHFESVLANLINNPNSWPRPVSAPQHLDSFSFSAFINRCQRASNYLNKAFN